jgi:4-diphosphocytidyl-2-C-methyl-D-erythritol kinase
MKREVTVRAPAKINLSLGVGPARADGYHPLATVYQAIGLYDDIRVRPSPRDVLRVTGVGVDVSDVPRDASNLAMRAAHLLAAHHGLDEPVDMRILKRIPVAGGMAGGSTDAAGALVACDALWETRTPREELMSLAAELGSDVPFCLVGGTAIGSGRGELVAPAMTRGTYWWVIAPGKAGLSTAQVYAEFDRLHASSPADVPEIPDELMSALRTGDIEALGASLSNDLQPAALRLRPELGDLMAFGVQGSAHGAIVSGSGPTVVFLAENETHATQVRGWLWSESPDLPYAPGPVPGASVIR